MIRAFGNRAWLSLMMVGVAGLLVACSSSDDDGGGGGGVTDTTITGSVVAAPVSGASVLIKDTNGNTVAGPVTTGSGGGFSVDVPNSSLSGVLIFESSDGTFDDEATGFNRTAGTMAAYLAGGSLSAGSTVHLTPASTIVNQMITNYSMTHSAAQSAFADAFDFAADTSIAPADATNPTVGATQAQLLAGLRAAAFSQLTMDLGLTVIEQFDLLAALAEDLTAGSLDGMGTGGAVTIVGTTMLPIDIQNRFAQAMVNFHGGVNDNTGLANDKIGTLPFAKVALSNSYKIEYIPGTMAAMEGKTMFELRITSHDGTTPLATGTAVSLMPMMNMMRDGMGRDMMHGSPSDGCTEVTPGTYSCTIYYIMASTMSGGMSMGYWELMVMAGMGGESATFYPQVMMDMDMANTHKAVILKGQSGDMLPGMMGMPDENRKFYLFKESLSGMGDNRTFNLFLAAKEDMDNYPAVDGTTTLKGGIAGDIVITAMAVEVSTNPTDPASWIAATGNGNGHWQAGGIAGLTDGTAGTIYVSLTINGEQKTTDGAVPAGDGTNDYTGFTITPGGM